MDDTLTDEQIDALESQGRAPAGDDGLTDAQIDQLEAQQRAGGSDQKPMGWGEYIGRGLTGTLPYLGAAGGAVAGTMTPAGPLGGVGAGAMGYEGGAEAEKLLNHYLFGDNDQPTNLHTVANNLKTGAEQEMGGQAFGKLVEMAAPGLKQMARNATIRHLRPTPKVGQALGKERLNDIADEVLDSGAMRPFSKAETTANNLEDLKDESGSLIGDLIEQSQGKANPVQIADQFDQQVIAPLRKTSGNKSLIAKLEGQRDDFLEQYAPQEFAIRQLRKTHPELDLNNLQLPKEEMSPAQVEAQKRVEQKRVGTGYMSTEPPLNTEAQMGWANVLKNAGEDAVNDPAFQAAKRAYGNQALASKMAGRTAALTDGGTGLFGHMLDLGLNLEALEMLARGEPMGLAVSGLRAATKNRMASTLGRAFNGLSKVAASRAGQAGANYLSRPVWRSILENYNQ